MSWILALGLGGQLYIYIFINKINDAINENFQKSICFRGTTTGGCNITTIRSWEEERKVDDYLPRVNLNVPLPVQRTTIK